MSEPKSPPARVVPAVHGRRVVSPDPAYELGLSEFLRTRYGLEGLIELHGRFANGAGAVDALMRRAIWRAATRRFGHGVTVGGGVGFKHIETFEIDDGVFIGDQAYLQGRYDGTCRIGARSWIGPQSYFDARDMIIGEDVGWGPGAKVLGSTHSGLPVDVPVIRTDLEVRPVRIEDGADVGTGAIVLPGVTVGRMSIVGAGAVVTRDVPPFAVVAGIPARVIRWREGHEPAGAPLA